MKKLPRPLLCLLGLHRIAVRIKFIPSITAEVVTEYRVLTACVRCRHTAADERFVWDGEDFHLAANEKELTL